MWYGKGWDGGDGMGGVVGIEGSLISKPVSLGNLVGCSSMYFCSCIIE